MRFYNAPKRNLQDKFQYESSIEILPNWKRGATILLVIACVYIFVISAGYLLRARKAQADETLYHRLDREFPRLGSLVYVPFGDCLHMARFDPDTGYFYDDVGWLGTQKWLYVTDRWPDGIETCTSEDLENAPRFQ